uniref:Ricin B lectin domain-containing protein n=2 Tax=Lotharella globosa TaxID=91324 RepID=A0A7S4DIQ4_9EUKA|mmetsp:Transcript_17555/g.33395  ORF Transcript_17555/g.33395 Transcript_17555/m.33395 type:complete len:136 (+) Transcript_17555:824-1231(+)
MHSHGGSHAGTRLTLHSCPKANNHSNCQWVVEPSPTKPRCFYLRISDTNNYAHIHGGLINGGTLTLHPCPKRNDHPNCQWRFVESTTRLGHVYIRPCTTNRMAIHAWGGSLPGVTLRMHPCQTGRDHANCQWLFE